MENKQLRDQFESCQGSYDKFVLSTHEIALAEERTIEKMRACKRRILELQKELKRFINALEHVAGYIELPLY